VHLANERNDKHPTVKRSALEGRFPPAVQESILFEAAIELCLSERAMEPTGPRLMKTSAQKACRAARLVRRQP
jgi:hypothetical protein